MEDGEEVGVVHLQLLFGQKMFIPLLFKFLTYLET